MVSTRRYWIAAFLIACVASLISFLYFTRLNRVERIVVAAADIPVRTLIDRSMVAYRAIPVAGVHPLAAKAVDDVVGRYASGPIVAGEQVITARLSSHERPYRFTSDISPNHRAIIIPVRPGDGVGSSVRSGDIVDIVMACDEKLFGRPLARTIAWGLRVLDVRTESGASFTKSQDGQPVAIVLEVSPQEAERIIFAMHYGAIFFSINGYDGKSEATTGVTPDDLFIADVHESE